MEVNKRLIERTYGIYYEMAVFFGLYSSLSFLLKIFPVPNAKIELLLFTTLYLVFHKMWIGS